MRKFSVPGNPTRKDTACTVSGPCLSHKFLAKSLRRHLWRRWTLCLPTSDAVLTQQGSGGNLYFQVSWKIHTGSKGEFMVIHDTDAEKSIIFGASCRSRLSLSWSPREDTLKATSQRVFLTLSPWTCMRWLPCWLELLSCLGGSGLLLPSTASYLLVDMAGFTGGPTDDTGATICPEDVPPGIHLSIESQLEDYLLSTHLLSRLCPVLSSAVARLSCRAGLFRCRF